MRRHGKALLLDAVDRRLLNDFQSGFPLVPEPFAEIAGQLGVGESEVIARIERLAAAGAVSRVGPVLRPRHVGASTLAAMAVPEDRIEEVAELVNGYREVNHNYERTHRFNLWFVLTAADEERLTEVMHEIEDRTGIEVLDLPMIEEYHIDLGFPLQWT
ncbi:AsnC family transcriptional regulator [Candidatus Thiosymbion oneisti]|uniref:AsnC family transcriptional regulator n=1 Tax=Candidatus Thiosymbion oneisti TaxID=589554 RepID=UPI001A9C297C|nr:AsnC family transcriptional regulator [Candidatus Thiosymbion oneisti]